MNLFLKDDSDDDLNDEDIPGFGAGTPLLNTPDKGKGRTPQNQTSPGLPPPVVSGSINNTPGNAPRSSARQNFGGVQLETRYASDVSPSSALSLPYRKAPSSLVMVE